MKSTVTTAYRLSIDDNAFYHPDYFPKVKEAVKVAKEEYRDRKKNDGYDKYWNTRKLIVQKVVTKIINVKIV